MSAEDEQDFQAPEESSVFYKLYSLLDILLMVRSTVDIAQPRNDQRTFRVSETRDGWYSAILTCSRIEHFKHCLLQHEL